MKLGNLRNQISIQCEQRLPDEQGGYALSWETLFTTWAEITPTGGKEKLAADKLQSTATHKIKLRRRDEDITAAMRAVCGTRVFNIRAVFNDNPRWTTILAEEGVAS